jgi:hypothetical protein
LNASRADIYAFTHSVLYASDMGRQKLASARRRRDIEADALVALGFALDTQDCDLTVEVLWVWPMLRLRWHPAALFALKGLIEKQDSLGFLPGIGFDARRVEEMSPEQRERHVRATCYHTVYVMGFLCAAASRHDPCHARRRIARSVARAGAPVPPCSTFCKATSISRNGAPAWLNKAPSGKTLQRRCCCRSWRGERPRPATSPACVWY